MNPAWQDLQTQCDELVERWRDGFVDTTGFVDLTQDHDPVTTEVLEEVR